jgi:DNA adenine methylase
VIDPFIKWAGGKRRMRKLLIPLVSHTLDARGADAVYVEPFLGGGSIALGLPAITKMILNDRGEDLIEAWRVVKEDPERVARMLGDMAQGHSAFYAIRSCFNAGNYGRFGRAVAFIYLNRTGFNGLWRVNAAGDFNVPWGKEVRPMPTAEHLVKIAQHLEGAVLQTRSAADLLGSLPGAEFVVYADPPYAASFSSYTKEGFGEDDRTELAEVLRARAETGDAVIVTDADVPQVRDLYAGWADIRSTREARAISADGGRSRAPCLLITANCEAS